MCSRNKHGRVLNLNNVWKYKICLLIQFEALLTTFPKFLHVNQGHQGRSLGNCCSRFLQIEGDLPVGYVFAGFCVCVYVCVWKIFQEVTNGF